MNLKTKFGFGVLAVMIVGAIFILIRSPKGTGMSYPTPGNPATDVYTMADVEAHGTQKSCWTTIGGKVYDLTSWIDQHPGGALAIISLCGKDGTESFQRQHGGQANPEAELKTLLIGQLVIKN